MQRIRRLAMAFLLAAISLFPAAGVWAQSVPAAPPALDLKDREIDLLKKQLDKANAQLKDETTARIVYETQLTDAAIHGYKVGDLLGYAPLTPQILERIFNDSIAKQYPGRDFDLYNWIHRFFGAIPEKMDVRGFMKELLVEQAGGLYDPESKKLYISPHFDVKGPMGRMILAHEIDHALQDQNFNMEKLGVMEKENDDRSSALMSILEGDATLLMGEAVVRDNPFAMLAELPKMATMNQQKINEAPAAIRDSMFFPYIGGMAFFQGLDGRSRQHPDGSAARMNNPAWRNDIFEEPPISSEQIMHPEKYLANEKPAEIPRLEPDAKDYPHLFRDVIGEFGIKLYLGASLDPEVAATAAAGWNGDRILETEDESAAHHTLHWITRWDTKQDADEFQSALAEALEKRFKNEGLKWHSTTDGRGAAFGATQISIKRTAPDGVRLDVATDLIPGAPPASAKN